MAQAEAAVRKLDEAKFPIGQVSVIAKNLEPDGACFPPCRMWFPAKEPGARRRCERRADRATLATSFPYHGELDQ